MPRNSSGVYQLPAGNPVVSGTLIESNWANTTMADMAQALTESLDRFGRSTMAAPLMLGDGTVAAPGLAFGAESSTGLYRESSKILGVSIGGLEVARFTQSGLAILGALTATGISALPDGTAAAPALSFTADTNLGLYRPAADILGIAANGADALRVDASGLLVMGTARIGAVATRLLYGGATDDTTTPHQFAGDAIIRAHLRVQNAASGVAAPAVGYETLVVENNAAGGLSVLTPAGTVGGIAFGRPGSPADGAIRYDHSSNTLSLWGGGSLRLAMDGTYIGSPQRFSGPDATVGGPAFVFAGETNTGLYRAGAGTIGFAGSGLQVGTIGPGGFIAGAGASQWAGGGRVSVEANGSTSAVVALNLSATKAGYLYTDSTGLQLGAAGSRFLQFVTNGAERARITENPNAAELLIGTSASHFTYSNRTVLEVGGPGDTSFGISAAGTPIGFILGAQSSGQLIISPSTGMKLSIGYNGFAGTAIQVDTAGVTTYAGNEIGWRNVPISAQPSSGTYQLQPSDRGKYVYCLPGCAGVLVGLIAGMGSAGEVYTIINWAGPGLAITSSGTSVQWGTGASISTSARSLAKNAVVTLFCLGSNTYLLKGDGIS